MFSLCDHFRSPRHTHYLLEVISIPGTEMSNKISYLRKYWLWETSEVTTTTRVFVPVCQVSVATGLSMCSGYPTTKQRRMSYSRGSRIDLALAYGSSTLDATSSELIMYKITFIFLVSLIHYGKRCRPRCNFHQYFCMTIIQVNERSLYVLVVKSDSTYCTYWAKCAGNIKLKHNRSTCSKKKNNSHGQGFCR